MSNHDLSESMIHALWLAQNAEKETLHRYSGGYWAGFNAEMTTPRAVTKRKRPKEYASTNTIKALLHRSLVEDTGEVPYLNRVRLTEEGRSIDTSPETNE